MPTTNKASKSDFAVLDLLVRTKPNASVQTIQALTMWYRNKTLGWLDEKSEVEKEELFESARKNFSKMKDKYDQRSNELKQKKADRLAEKQLKEKSAIEKADLKKANAVNELINQKTRVWLTIDDADEEFVKIEEKNKKGVLQAQLNFYRFVMNVTNCPIKLFNKTKLSCNKRVDLSPEELFENLKTIIKTRHLPEPSRTSDNLRDKSERETLFNEQKNEFFEKIQNARLSHLVKQQKINILPGLMNDPYMLVGKLIRHKVKELDNEEAFWCKGEVKSLVKLATNVKRSEYEVVYESELDKIWTFPLLVDFEKGDLIML